MPAVSDLLRPIPGPNPSGEDIRYSTLFERIKEARREEPDLPQGVWQRERKTADWAAVAELCTDALVNHTKDLRIASWLTEALLHRDGLPGLAEGLIVLRSLVQDFWPTLYPLPVDDDLEFRAAPLEWAGSRLDAAVKSVPLSSAGMTWFDLSAACNRTAPQPEEPAGRVSPARVHELDACLAALDELDAVCEARFAGDAPSVDVLRRTLETVRLDIESLIPKAAVENVGCAAEAVGPQLAPDLLHFTFTAPFAIEPAVAAVLSLWVHSDAQRAEVLDRAGRQYRGLAAADFMSVSRGPVRIGRGVLLTVRLEIPGVRVDDPEDSVLWDGEIGSVNFVFTLPGSGPRSFPGRAVIYASGVQVAKVQFVLEAASAAPGRIAARDTWIRRAFASYASADRDEVLGRIQGICKAAPHMEIFFDVLTLRSGSNWQSEIEKLIALSDVFYLFWSVHARNSMSVEQEWRTALGTGRPGLIDPVPLQPAEEAPPPPELAGLHFNDWMLAFERRRFGKAPLRSAAPS